MLGKYALTKSNSRAYLYGSALLVYGLMLLFLPRTGLDWDTYCWAQWAERIQKTGLASAYAVDSPVNYLPLYLYVLQIYGIFVDSSALYSSTYLLKALPLAFDLLSLVFICHRVKQPRLQLAFFFLGCLNLAYLYNSLFWNQVDGILGFFLLASFYYGYEKRFGLSALFYVLALNFKLQAILFLPLFLLLMARGGRPKLKPLSIWLALLIALEMLLLSPYIRAGNLNQIIQVALSSVDYYPAISMNASNFWHLIYAENLMFKPDTALFIGPLNHKQVGYLLFFASTGLLLWKPAWNALKNLFSKPGREFSLEVWLYSGLLIFFCFFFFNTQMHERYIHPALVFSTALAFVYRHWLQWFLLSLAYLLNLEAICRFSPLPELWPFFFDPRTVACLYVVVGVVSVWGLWRGYKKSTLETPTVES